jgi:hypothetical protein
VSDCWASEVCGVRGFFVGCFGLVSDLYLNA